MTNTKKIKLRDGSILEIEHNDEFVEAIREKLELESTQEVDDDHIRAFVYGTFNNALSAYEEKGKHATIDNSLPVQFEKQEN